MKEAVIGLSSVRGDARGCLAPSECDSLQALKSIDDRIRATNPSVGAIPRRARGKSGIVILARENAGSDLVARGDE